LWAARIEGGLSGGNGGDLGKYRWRKSQSLKEKFLSEELSY